MTDLAPSRRNVQVEETRFRAPLSENTMDKVGQSINFINDYQHSEKQFFLNGRYNSVSMPQIAADGMAFFQFDAEIIDVWMFCEKVGSSGSTKLDLLLCASSGSSFASIFSTRPEIGAAAGDFSYIHSGSTVSGATAPVISTVNVNAGQALRCDLLTSQVGVTTENCGIVVHYRPR